MKRSYDLKGPRNPGKHRNSYGHDTDVHLYGVSTTRQVGPEKPEWITVTGTTECYERSTSSHPVDPSSSYT